MLKKIFTAEGRLNRLPYLKYSFLLLVMSFLLNVLVAFVVILSTGSAEGTLFYVLSFVVTLPISVGAFMLSIRRLHDLNRSGLFVILALIPIVNILFEIYLLFFRGTVGANDYGEDPLGF